MIQERILELTEYGLVTGLVEPEDRRFTINRLLELFHLDELEDEVAAAYAKRTPMTQESAEAALEDILNEMLDYAAEDGLMPEDTITPARVASMASMLRAAWATASRAAIRANWVKRARCLARCLPRSSAASQSFTSAASVTLRSVGS